MKLNIYISLVIVVLSHKLSAQPMPAVSQFDKNMVHLNPGAVGNQDVLTVSFAYRNQWTGFKGAPSNQVFTVHAPMKNPEVAIGLLLENENSGSTNYTGIYLNYAYRIKILSGKLSFGLKCGVNAVSQSAVSLRDDAFDPAFTAKNNNFIVPNFGFGAYYYSNSYWAGFSIPRLFGFESKSSGAYKMSYDISHYEYFIAGGGKLSVNSKIDIEPSALLVLSSVHKPRVMVNAKGVYKKSYKVGVGYRSGDAIIIIIGYDLNRQFSLGYSYDINISHSMSKYTSGSHEINMQYRFGYQINASSPRHF
jgi:type IX secretion system PorP/SprF family membrane protein